MKKYATHSDPHDVGTLEEMIEKYPGSSMIQEIPVSYGKDETRDLGKAFYWFNDGVPHFKGYLDEGVLIKIISKHRDKTLKRATS